MEKAQAVFLLWVELEAVDAFLVLSFCVFDFVAIEWFFIWGVSFPVCLALCV